MTSSDFPPRRRSGGRARAAPRTWSRHRSSPSVNLLWARWIDVSVPETSVSVHGQLFWGRRSRQGRHGARRPRGRTGHPRPARRRHGPRPSDGPPPRRRARAPPARLARHARTLRARSATGRARLGGRRGPAARGGGSGPRGPARPHQRERAALPPPGRPAHLRRRGRASRGSARLDPGRCDAVDAGRLGRTGPARLGGARPAAPRPAGRLLHGHGPVRRAPTRLGEERGRARGRRRVGVRPRTRSVGSRRRGSLHLRTHRATLAPARPAARRDRGRGRQQADRGAAPTPRDAAAATAAAERLSPSGPSADNGVGAVADGPERDGIPPAAPQRIGHDPRTGRGSDNHRRGRRVTLSAVHRRTARRVSRQGVKMQTASSPSRATNGHGRALLLTGALALVAATAACTPDQVVGASATRVGQSRSATEAPAAQRPSDSGTTSGTPAGTPATVPTTPLATTATTATATATAAPTKRPPAKPAPSPSATTTTPTAKPEPAPVIVLRAGDTGPKVRSLQARLRQLSWFQGDVSDRYGTKTTDAVRGFQGKRGLDATGTLDERTWVKLVSMTRRPTADELANVKPAPVEAAPPPAAASWDVDPRCLTGRVMCVSKATRELTWVVDGVPQYGFDVRFGSDELPTREGVFSVYKKKVDVISNLYHTPMPYSMFFSGGQAVHYSSNFARLGYAGASHGCVNVRNKPLLIQLYNEVRLGDKVVVHW